jgi:hypothetical protein
MNVWADDDNKGPIVAGGSPSAGLATNQSENIVRSNVYLAGSNIYVKYIVEVSPAIWVNLNECTTSASDLNGNMGSNGMYMKLTQATDWGEGANLIVTPTFAVDTDDSVKVAFSALATESDNNSRFTCIDSERRSVSDLGITDKLLTFGDSTSKGLKLTPDDKDKVKAIKANVNDNEALIIRSNIPSSITGSDGQASATAPHINEDRPIGYVTFDCEFNPGGTP